jgi:hypothetical protein
METKQTESQIEKFSKAVEALDTEMLDDSKGFLIFSYGELEDGTIEASFASRGKLGCMAECLHRCMKKNEMLANIVIAASNAIVQARMMEAQIQQQVMENTTETKKKKTRKPKN